MRIQYLLPFGAIIASSALLACGSNSNGSSGPVSGVGGNNAGGSTGTHTSSSTNPSVGGNASTGGTSSNATGGTNSGAGGTSSSQSTTANTGGKSSAGGTSAATGGKSSTSTATGGKATTGGTNSGNTGGKATTGGTNSGNTGGKATTGGTSSGNTGVGGGATGGDTSVGATGGSSSTGNRPKGYWQMSDWNKPTDWHGCAWTGVDKVASTTTKITPQDFMSASPSDPYQVTGTVNKSYEAVALLGFNIGEAIGTDANQCKYDPTKTTEDGPPAATMTSIVTSTKGLAINWTAKTKPGMFRVQLQEPDCASNLGHCYCATITDATGPSFVKWGDFAAYCWNADGSDTAHPLPVKYTNTGIDAVVFSAPGNGSADTAFDFTVVGFAPGDSAADAPGKPVGCGEMIGTLGNGGPSKDASMQRAPVTDTNCKKYIVFNNNWGNPTGSTQTIDYSGNSFTVKTSTGNGSGAPASFPSIYVGASGDQGGGTYSTWTDTGLPKAVSAIQSAQTTFTWTGNTGNYNAAYDIWFADKTPSGTYNDAVAAFLMVWLYQPQGQSPIGGSSKRKATGIAGHDWDVWVGPRGNTSTGTLDANRPVISYVISGGGPLKTLTFNIKDFMDDAIKNAATDKSNGGTSLAFSSSLLLTDVFAGFEAWSGGSIVGNTAKMSIVVQ